MPRCYRVPTCLVQLPVPYQVSFTLFALVPLQHLAPSSRLRLSVYIACFLDLPIEYPLEYIVMGQVPYLGSVTLEMIETKHDDSMANRRLTTALQPPKVGICPGRNQNNQK